MVQCSSLATFIQHLEPTVERKTSKVSFNHTPLKTHTQSPHTYMHTIKRKNCYLLTLKFVKLKNEPRGWWDGSVVKEHWLFFQRTEVQSPTPTRWLQPSHSSSEVQTPSSGPLKHCIYVVYRYIFRQTFLHKNKNEYFKILKRNLQPYTW